MTARVPGRARRFARWMLISCGALLAALALATLAIYASYLDWRGERLLELERGSRIAETRAGPIEYTLRGVEGPLMLFVHGRPGGYDSAPAATPDRRVLTPSRPGYLRTPLEVGATPAEQADAYAALLDALGLTAPVMGASGGGPSAISFAARYPERTDRLVLVEPVSRPMSQGDRPGFMRRDFTVWIMFTALEVLRGPEGIVSLVIPDPDNRRRILDDAERTANFSELVWSMWPVSLRNAGWDSDTHEFAALDLPSADIAAPVLIVHGSADENVSVADSVALAAEIPGATLRIIEGADHMMPFTHRDEVARIVDAFLSAPGAPREARPDQSFGSEGR